MDGQKIKSYFSSFFNILVLYFAIDYALKGDYTRMVIYGAVAIFLIGWDIRSRLLSRPDSPSSRSYGPQVDFHAIPYLQPYINDNWKESYRTNLSPAVEKILEPGPQAEKLERIELIDDQDQLKNLFVSVKNETIKNKVLEQITDCDFLLTILTNVEQLWYRQRKHILSTVTDSEFHTALLDMRVDEVDRMIMPFVTDQELIYEVSTEIINGDRSYPGDALNSMLSRFEDKDRATEILTRLYSNYLQDRIAFNPPYSLFDCVPQEILQKLLERIAKTDLTTFSAPLRNMTRNILQRLEESSILHPAGLIIEKMMGTDFDHNFSSIIEKIIEKVGSQLAETHRLWLIKLAAQGSIRSNEIEDIISSVDARTHAEMFEELIRNASSSMVRTHLIKHIENKKFLRELLSDHNFTDINASKTILKAITLSDEELNRLIGYHSQSLPTGPEDSGLNKFSGAGANLSVASGRHTDRYHSSMLTELLKIKADTELICHYVADSTKPASLRQQLLTAIDDRDFKIQLLLDEMELVDNQILDNTYVLKKQGDEVIEIPYQEYTPREGERVATRYSAPQSVRLVKKLIPEITDLDTAAHAISKLTLQRSVDEFKREFQTKINELTASWSQKELDQILYDQQYQVLLPFFINRVKTCLLNLLRNDDGRFYQYSTLNTRQNQYSKVKQVLSDVEFSQETLRRLCLTVSDWHDLRTFLPFVTDPSFFEYIYSKSTDSPGYGMQRKILAIRNMGHEHQDFLKELIQSSAPYVLRNEAVGRLTSRNLLLQLIHMDDEFQTRQEANQYLEGYRCRCRDRLFDHFKIDIRITALNRLVDNTDYDMLRELQQTVSDTSVLNELTKRIAQLT